MVDAFSIGFDRMPQQYQDAAKKLFDCRLAFHMWSDLVFVPGSLSTQFEALATNIFETNIDVLKAYGHMPGSDRTLHMEGVFPSLAWYISAAHEGGVQHMPVKYLWAPPFMATTNERLVWRSHLSYDIAGLHPVKLSNASEVYHVEEWIQQLHKHFAADVGPMDGVLAS